MAEATPTQAVSAWLADFAAALERRDIPAALALFDDDCYWRDLVSFTWNIETAEGKAAVAAMLEATLGDTKPGPWEGELRNMWKPTQQEALWFHGGNLHQSRHCSQFLSLQIEARLEGIPTPVYGMGPVHHAS